MRILHLVSSRRWTGAAEPATSLALEQRALGHDVSIACQEGGGFRRKLEEFGIPSIEGFDFRPGIYPLGIRSDIRALRSFIAEKAFDVVHCHLQHDHWLAAAALGRISSRRKSDSATTILVRTFHRDVPPRADFIHQRLYAGATNLLITVSRSGHAAAMEKLKLGPDRVVWIRGGVDLQRFHPGLDRMQNRRLWEIPAEAPVAGIIARMQPHRGHELLIRTFNNVVSAIPGAYYIVAGQGEMKLELSRMMKEHPHSARLIDAGYRRNDLPETYAAMDVSVLLAQGSDGTCRAMLEAMACGRPVIGIRVGAIEDTIEPGKTGWLIEPGSEKELAQALIEAFSDLKRTAEMGARARAKMEAEFTLRGRAEATLSAYERILEAHKTGE